MKTSLIIAATIATAIASSLVAGAQSTAPADEVQRPVTAVFQAGVGHSSVLDTYLSPVTYRGTVYRLSYERMQTMRLDSCRWVQQLDCGIEYSPAHNSVGNHTEHYLMLDFQWGMARRWRDVLVPGLQLQLGGSTQFRGGGIYNPGNSNNVVSAKIHWSVGATAMAAYTLFPSRRVPVTLRYAATLPLAGVFFSPEYDESYYEIYVGNRSGLANFGWWGNRFDLTQQLTADLHLGSTIVRIGYRGRIETSWIKNLNTHIFTHSLVVGLGGEWLSLSRRKAKAVRAVSAFY